MPSGRVTRAHAYGAQQFVDLCVHLVVTWRLHLGLLLCLLVHGRLYEAVRVCILRPQADAVADGASRFDLILAAQHASVHAHLQACWPPSHE